MSVTDRNVAMGVASILGISTPIYLPWGETEDYTAGNYESIISVTPEEEGLLSSLGTPVLGSFTLLGGTYDTYNSDGEIESIKLPDFCMPYATVVDFNRSMAMSKTNVLGNSGSVKEMFGLNDWTISIRGLCATDNTRLSCKTAKEQIDALVEWRKVTDTINVSGKLFNDKEIYGICIEDFQIRQIQGKYNVIVYEIKAVSDNVIELAL